MTALGSSLRTLGLGSLFKVAGIAAATVTYLLLRRIRERRAEDREDRSKQQKGARSYRYSFSPEERARVQKVKVESPAHILADIKEPETMQVLDETLSTPTPAEESNQPEDLSAKSDEVRDKLAAIKAIGCMAAGGNPRALSLLFKHMQNENFLVRREAILGILQYGGKEDRELLKKTLPAGDWYIMDIRPADIRKVCR